MPLHVLAWGFEAFLCAFVSHWALWRLLGVPRAPALTLSLHCLAVAAAFAAAGFKERAPSFDLAASALLYVALCCAYVQTIPFALVFSPSFEILLRVGRSGALGCVEQDIRALFDAERLLDKRVEELLKAGMVLEIEGELRPTWRGRLSVPLFLYMRRIMGLSPGQG